MADQTATAQSTPAPAKAEAPTAAAAPAPKPVAAAAPAPKPEAAKAPKPVAETAAKPVTSEKKPAARKAKASTRIKAAKPARKLARTAQPKPARKPVARKIRKPAAAGAIVNKGAKIMTNQTRKTVDASLFAADQIKTVFGDVNERAKSAVERSAKIVEEMADLTRGNVEAFVASSKVAAKGVETLSQEAAEYSRKSFEEASTALKGLAEVKSATDFFKLQGDFARAAFDNAVAESARLSETVLKLAGDVAQPITSRYNVAAERVKTLAA